MAIKTRLYAGYVASYKASVEFYTKGAYAKDFVEFQVASTELIATYSKIISCSLEEDFLLKTAQQFARFAAESYKQRRTFEKNHPRIRSNYAKCVLKNAVRAIKNPEEFLATNNLKDIMMEQLAHSMEVVAPTIAKASDSLI